MLLGTPGNAPKAFMPTNVGPHCILCAMILLLLFLQKQSLAFDVYLFFLTYFRGGSERLLRKHVPPRDVSKKSATRVTTNDSSSKHLAEIRKWRVRSLQ
jgi:hypothetical protein